MRNYVKFVLNGEVQKLRQFPPTLTLLQFLRQQRRLTGTKEGCGEGDCGACTVAVGQLIAGDIHYQAVNSCIQFVGMLEGKVIHTVEALKACDGRMHPFQQAMVDEHASQCGFCTPGFVMSLYVAYIEGMPLDEDSSPDLLAGNLCRCTGYGPIAAAAAKCRGYPRPDWANKLRESDREVP